MRPSFFVLCFRFIQSISPVHNQDIGHYVQLARKALGERRFQDARSIYRKILELDPNQPRAWLALSALAQTEGDFREAVQSVRSAAGAWKSSGTQAFVTELCMRLLVLGEYKQARDIIAGADWSDPIVLRYSMGLVQYLGLAEAHEEALQLADHALSKLQDAPAALVFARANALRYLGRMEEAADAYERCLAIDPLHAEAHWTLAHHRRSQPASARVPRIRRAIAHTQAGTEDAIYLHYALFKELDDAGDTKEAWRALEAGARMKRASLRYEADAFDAGYRALEALCSREFLSSQRPQAGSDATHTPIFIVGLPRSGTTLLERMLGNHPQVRSAGELNDFPLQLSWETNRFLGESPSRTTLEACRNIDFAALGNGYLQRTAWRAQGAPFLIDKLPNNIVHAGFIHKALPQAKIICLRRNPMDSCFSTFKHLFSGNAYPYSYDLQEMAAHYHRFSQLVEHWKSAIDGSFLALDYERLVIQPEEAVQEVARFCGLSYQPEMLDLKGNASPSATASASQVREAVHPRNLGGWKRYAEVLNGLDVGT